MKVLKVEPNKKPELVWIDDTLEALQDAVGGYIECICPFPEHIGLVCNEEGKLNGLKPNRALRDESGRVYDIVFGTFLLVGLRAGDFVSLTSATIDKYMKFFSDETTPSWF